MRNTLHTLSGAALLAVTTTSAMAHPGHETLPGLVHLLTSISHAGAPLLLVAAVLLVVRRRRAK